jgi:acyl carrier protein
VKSGAEIEVWLLDRLQARLPNGSEKIDGHMPFSYYGLDSIDAVELAAELETWLGVPVSATLTFDYPTASAVATYLAGEPELPAPGAADPDISGLLAELDLSAQAPSSSASGPTVK